MTRFFITQNNEIKEFVVDFIDHDKTYLIEKNNQIIVIEAEEYLNAITVLLYASDGPIDECVEIYIEELNYKYPKKEIKFGNATDEQIKELLLDEWNESALINGVDKMTISEVREIIGI